MKTFSKNQIATGIAVIFHIVGIIGILFLNRDMILSLTWVNLLLMLSLLIYTHPERNGPFYFFMVICMCTGIGVELLGTKTGWLFGSYTYGNVLGPGVQNVPFIIGVNWFIVIYCCGITIQTILNRLLDRLSEQTGTERLALRAASMIIDGATLAVFFDWIMEPVAMKLGYWNWEGSEIPLYNYVSWFVVSSALLAVFHYAKFKKQNKFAVNLLLIQMMFFLLLRTFL